MPRKRYSIPVRRPRKYKARAKVSRPRSGGRMGDRRIEVAKVNFGNGAYTSYNALFPGRGSDSTNAKFSSARDETGTLYVNHKEYLSDQQCTQFFNNQSFLINPNNQTLFPWLSQISANYDEFEFHALIFEFRTLTADVSTSATQIGAVMMACDYNAGAQPFVSQSQMLNYTSAISCKISDNLMLGVECDPKKNGLGAILYNPNNGITPFGQDPKTYNLGTLQIATSGCATNGNDIGQLWVHYRVSLRKPKMGVALGNQISTVNCQGVSAGYLISGGMFGTFGGAAPNLAATPFGYSPGTTNGFNPQNYSNIPFAVVQVCPVIVNGGTTIFGPDYTKFVSPIFSNSGYIVSCLNSVSLTATTAYLSVRFPDELAAFSGRIILAWIWIGGTNPEANLSVITWGPNIEAAYQYSGSMGNNSATRFTQSFIIVDFTIGANALTFNLGGAGVVLPVPPTGSNLPLNKTGSAIYFQIPGLSTANMTTYPVTFSMSQMSNDFVQNEQMESLGLSSVTATTGDLNTLPYGSVAGFTT